MAEEKIYNPDDIGIDGLVHDQETNGNEGDEETKKVDDQDQFIPGSNGQETDGDGGNENGGEYKSKDEETKPEGEGEVPSFSDDNLDPDLPDAKLGDSKSKNEKYTLEDLGLGDNFKTVDDIKKANIPNVLKEHNELKKELAQLRKFRETVKEKAKNLANPFADESIKKYNDFAKSTGINEPFVANAVMNNDIDAMDDKQVLILAEIAKNPELANKRVQLENKINRTYKLGEYRDKDDDDEFIDDPSAQEDMELAASTAKKELKDLKSKIKSEDANIDDLFGETQEVDPEKVKGQWGTVAEKIVENVKKIPIFGKGDNPYGYYELNEKQQSAIKDEVINNAVTNGLLLTEENGKETVQRAYNTVVNRLLLENQRSINTAIYNLGKKAQMKEYQKKNFNPSGGSLEDGARYVEKQGGQEGILSADEAADRAMRDYY